MTDDGEIELFEAQIANSVMTLGWIHTHPQFVTLKLKRGFKLLKILTVCQADVNKASVF